jgi:hypothetical protein
MKNLTDRNLKIMFDALNKRFFDSRLCENIWVQFVPQSKIISRVGKHGADGSWFPGDREILIDKVYARSPSMAAIILLHEMVHADLAGVYFGQAGDDGHGMVYQSELVRLFKAGAYDGLL